MFLKIQFLKINLDIQVYRNTPKRYDLTGVTTFATFLNGEIKEKIVSAQTKKGLIRMIENIVT
jgi:hypothetical protein